MTRKNVRRAALAALTLAAVIATTAHLAHLTLDWYPAMGVHAVNITLAHHWIAAGWVQVRPGHTAFRFFCDHL